MERNMKTLYCGNLADEVSEELLYELFLQAGPVEEVKILKDKNGKSRGFGFVTFKHAVSVPYALQLMAGESLFGRALRMQERGSNPGSPVVHHNGHQKSHSCPPGFNFDARNSPVSPRPNFDSSNNCPSPAFQSFANANNRLAPNYGGGGGSINIGPINGCINGPNPGMGYPQMHSSPPVSNGSRFVAWYPNNIPSSPNFLNPGIMHRDLERRQWQNINSQAMRPVQSQYMTPAKMQQDKLRFRDIIQPHWKASRR